LRDYAEEVGILLACFEDAARQIRGTHSLGLSLAAGAIAAVAGGAGLCELLAAVGDGLRVSSKGIGEGLRKTRRRRKR
jgi:hypothetical protein